MMNEKAELRVPVWDPIVRITHWLIVVLVSFSWWAAEEREMEWHMQSGYALLFLVLFRLYWGFFGTETARFSQFVRGPRNVILYMRNFFRRTMPVPTLGHNPVGGWSVVILLAAILLQVLLGLVATDVDGLESGPRSYLVSFETGRTVAELHETLFSIMQAVILIHIVAVLFYGLYKRINLVGPMIVGTKKVPATDDALRLSVRGLSMSWRSAVLGMALVGFVSWILIWW